MILKEGVWGRKGHKVEGPLAASRNGRIVPLGVTFILTFYKYYTFADIVLKSSSDYETVPASEDKVEMTKTTNTV